MNLTDRITDHLSESEVSQNLSFTKYVVQTTDNQFLSVDGVGKYGPFSLTKTRMWATEAGAVGWIKTYRYQDLVAGLVVKPIRISVTI